LAAPEAGGDGMTRIFVSVRVAERFVSDAAGRARRTRPEGEDARRTDGGGREGERRRHCHLAEGHSPAKPPACRASPATKSPLRRRFSWSAEGQNGLLKKVSAIF
jgi:hypothetical protein